MALGQKGGFMQPIKNAGEKVFLFKNTNEVLFLAKKRGVVLTRTVMDLLPEIDLRGEIINHDDVVLSEETELGLLEGEPVSGYDAIREAKNSRLFLFRAAEAIKCLIEKSKEFKDGDKILCIMYPIGNKGNKVSFLAIKNDGLMYIQAYLNISKPGILCTKYLARK